MGETELVQESKGNVFLKNENVKTFLPSILIIIVLTITSNILSPGFASIGNMMTISTRACILAVACIGQAYIMISGNAGIDMSIGAFMSMAALLTSKFSGGTNMGLVSTIFLFIGIGAFFGFITGACIQYFKIPSLVMTLAMSSVINGLALGVTRGQPQMTIPPALLSLGTPVVGVIRGMIFLTIIIVAVMMLVLHKTKYGKSLFIAGSNRSAAVAIGLKVNRIVIATYMISAVISCMAGLMMLGFVGSAQLQMGDEYTLLSVAAVVIGGTKLSGGRGGLVGGILGSFVLIILTSMLIVLGLPPGVRQLIQGALLLGIVLINSRELKLRN
ncbi:ABC transporter permease [Lachnospiraceae bacterium ZAX-1]